MHNLTQTEVRKAAHYLLLIFIKKYERIDEIIEGYLIRVKENADQWKQIQKIIHSFQSLLVIEPKSVTYPLDFNFINSFLRLLIGFRMHQHSLIQKAAEQVHPHSLRPSPPSSKTNTRTKYSTNSTKISLWNL